jgi:hypothetical protein
MKAEYAKIVDEVRLSYAITNQSREHTALREVAERCAERCEALANKPVRELTDDEIQRAWDKKSRAGFYESVRNVIAAHIAKQSEPDEIPFDQKKLDEGGWVIKLVPPGESSHTFSGQTKVTLVRKT